MARATKGKPVLIVHFEPEIIEQVQRAAVDCWGPPRRGRGGGASRFVREAVYRALGLPEDQWPPEYAQSESPRRAKAQEAPAPPERSSPSRASKRSQETPQQSQDAISRAVAKREHEDYLARLERRKQAEDAARARAIELSDEGKSARKIAQLLQRQGVPHPEGDTWAPAMVDRLLGRDSSR